MVVVIGVCIQRVATRVLKVQLRFVFHMVAENVVCIQGAVTRVL